MHARSRRPPPVWVTRQCRKNLGEGRPFDAEIGKRAFSNRRRVEGGQALMMDPTAGLIEEKKVIGRHGPVLGVITLRLDGRGVAADWQSAAVC